MSSRLKAIARETVSIAEQGGYGTVDMAADVARAVAGTRLYSELTYTDRVIYAPGVPVFRDDQGALLDESYPVSFLTAAAPNTGAIARNQPQYLPEVPVFAGALTSAPWFDTVVFAVLDRQAQAPTRAAFRTALLPG